jgi:hypothetical protein
VGWEAEVSYLAHDHPILVINLIVVVHNEEALIGSGNQTNSLSCKADMTHAISLSKSHLFEEVTGMIHHI